VGPIATEFSYSNQTIGLILSSFFIGYLLLQLAGGYLSTKYGALYVIGIGMLFASLFTILTPFAASTVSGLVMLRILTGVGESVIYPSVHAFLGQWAPKNERSTLLTCIWSGAYVGITVTLSTSSVIISNHDTTTSPLLQGWPGVFYVFGIFGLAWSICWMLLATSKPEQHPFISTSEKAFIIAARGASGEAGLDVSPKSQSKQSMAHSTVIPWKKLLTHRAVIALSTAHAAHNWLYYVILTWLPEFMRQQLNYDIKKIGAIAAMPYLACFVVSIIGGLAADYAIKRGVSRTHVRKAAQTVGELIPAITIVVAGYLEDVDAIIAMLALSVGIGGFANSGFAANHLDIAPQYAGILLGFGNTIATIPGIVAPMVVGAIVSPPHDDIQHWRIAFWLSAAICVFGWAVFMLFAEGEPINFDSNEYPSTVEVVLDEGTASVIRPSSAPMPDDGENAALIHEAASQSPRQVVGKARYEP
jgi:MFS family permease